MNVMTAAELGIELKRYIEANPGRADPRMVGAFVDRIAATPGICAGDALAFVTLADQLVRFASEGMDGDWPEEDRRHVLGQAAKLTRRAVEVLEYLTGFASDSFTAGLRQVH